MPSTHDRPRALRDQDVNTARHRERRLPLPLRAPTDTGLTIRDLSGHRATEPAGQPRAAKAFAAVILLGFAALLALATLQWATGITDDVRATRGMLEEQRGGGR